MRTLSDSRSSAGPVRSVVSPLQDAAAAIAPIPLVLYSVELTGADGSVTDVKVDAGIGAVLAQETGEDDGSSEGADQPEGPGDAQD